MRSSRLTVLLASVAALLASATAAEAKRAPAGFLGVAPSNVPSPVEFQRMAQGGVGSVRIQISWPAVQPQPNGPFDWSQIDTQVAGAAGAGLPVVPFFYGTPPWAANCAGIAADLCERALPTKSAAGAAGWSALLSAAVARYGPNGTFWKDPTDGFSPPFLPVRTWQIWNEPNGFIFSPPRPSVGLYYQLLKISKAALKGGDSGAQIMLGGLFGLPRKPGILLGKFLDKLYAKKGAKGLFDSVAVHPYGPTINKLATQLQDARDAMNEHGDRRTPVFVTELGWGSDSSIPLPPELGKNLLGQAGQARMLRKAFNLMIGKRKQFGLRGVYWFTWRDSNPGTGGRCYLCESAGLFTAQFQPKPAWNAFATIAGGVP